MGLGLRLLVVLLGLMMDDWICVQWMMDMVGFLLVVRYMLWSNQCEMPYSN